MHIIDFPPSQVIQFNYFEFLIRPAVCGRIQFNLANVLSSQETCTKFLLSVRIEHNKITFRTFIKVEQCINFRAVKQV